MKHIGTQTLQTQRLILRRFCIEDAPAMYQNWANDEQVTKYLRWPVHQDVNVTKSVLSDWIAHYDDPSYYQWAIVVKESGDVIGSIGVVEQKDEIAMVHIGYCIGRAWWHQGITSEALQALIHFFFREVGSNRIESMHDPRNENSGKVMEKCGMKLEGVLRQADSSNQGICDACLYALLAEDYN